MPVNRTFTRDSCSRRFDLRQDKPITIDPIWIFGVEGHELVEQDVGNGCHAHGSSGMTGVGFEGGIDLGKERLVSIGFSIFGW